MRTLVITGMGKEKAERLACDVAGDQFTVKTASDYEGIVALTTGQADYYLGICQSGAGGALALAIGMLGSAKCTTVSTLGKPPAPDAIESAVREGKVAYGAAFDHIEQVVPRLVRAIDQSGP